ncbi:MAG: toll/interleukin-1 receptor domain-containing protein, partial [Erysipelotrichaceae bacterium]|nr:toll/interleukin-1 receptor domain-containing protein [Erysipelotrichaceae bacterium]
MKKYHYKAFISYRHLSPDQDIARKLHKLIETYGIPSSLKKSLGIQKMGRVFRDQEELPLSSDLGHDIHEALDESEWFICICSPRYLESKWCMEELNYFINSGRRDHVLAILVEGEPEASFPEQIRFEYRGGKLIENEPLAADVRASNIQDALKKLNNEKLRIMAPMLDVRYDDLKQRDRIRKNRIIFSAALAVIALLSMFLIYALNKNRQITNERNEALIAESKWLSKSAKEALDNNDRMLSLLLYLEALPEDVDNPDRPIIDEAGNGLISALIGSDATSSYSGVSEIFIDPDENRHVIDLVAIDNRLYLTRRNTIEIYDLDSGAYLGDLDTNGETIYGSFIINSGDYYVYHFDS